MAYIFQIFIAGADGRNYNSKKTILQDWNDGKEFQIIGHCPLMPRYINKEYVESVLLSCVHVRYGKDLEKSATINVIKNQID